MELRQGYYLPPGTPVREAGLPPSLDRIADDSVPKVAPPSAWWRLAPATLGVLSLLLVAPAPAVDSRTRAGNVATSAGPSPEASERVVTRTSPRRKVAKARPVAQSDAPPAVSEGPPLTNIRVSAFGSPSPREESDDAPEASSTLGVILSHRAEIEACVEDQWEESPSLTGQLVMQWEVLSDGTTANIGSETPELEDSALSTCLVSRIRRWTFPPTTGEHPPIVFPIRF